MSSLKSIWGLFRRGDRQAASEAITHAMREDRVPDVEQIAEQTGVKPPEVSYMVGQLALADLRSRADEGIRLGSFSAQPIYDRALGYGVDEQAAKSTIEGVVSDHFTALVTDVLADGMIDPSEDSRIEAFMRMIGVGVLDANSQKLIDDGRALYHALSKPLDPVDAPVLLKKGEHCIHAALAEAIEERSRTVRVSYGGPSARIRIAKGIYYSAGSASISREVQAYEHSFGVGILCMTNKRLLWISEQKSISIPLANIVRYDPYTDGFRIMKGTGKPLLFMWQEKPRIATAMAARVIEELR